MLLIAEIYFDLRNNFISKFENIIIYKGLDKLRKLLLKLGFWNQTYLITIK